MADKVIKLKINVKDLKKEWFFKGEKGIYANVTVLFNEEQDGFGNNGMIVQDVPKDIYAADRAFKGPILGNCKVWGAAPAAAEAKVGEEVGKPGVDIADDDLPF